ncbi:MAG: ATP-binding protein, partial [Nitrosopumilaceae archaeon]
DEQNGQSALFMIVPVTSRAEEAEPLGVIIASRDMAIANKITTDRTNLGKTGETYVVNEDKVMVTDSRFIQKAKFNQEVDTLPVRECIENGKEVTGVYPDYRGIPVFGASHCEQDLGFVLLAEMDVAETYGPITELQKQYLMIGSITAIIVAIFSFYVSRSISKPIVKLTGMAEKISKGNLDTEVEELKSKNEIGKLLHSFKMMMLNLRNHIEQIENLSEKLKNANEELKRLDKLKDEFISIASHELKNPIQPILGFAYLAKRGQIPHDEAWDGVLQHSRRLKKLAADILDVSRIESGTLDYAMEKIRINDVILDVVNAAKVTLSKDVSIDVDLHKENMEIDVSKDRITQVLSNIIDNAMKFTKKGIIRVENYVLPEKNKVEIKISDTGVGIAEDIIPNLFGKFVSRSTQDGFDRDTGLGLFIAKAIITAHKGKISGHNNKEGGATFTIELPIDIKQKMN